MGRITRILAFFLILIIIQNTYAFRKSRAIFYYVKAGEGITIEHIETLKKAIRNALRNNPKFELVSDENIEAVFKRNGISEDGCTTTECAVKIGKDANIAADYVMYGELNLSDAGLFLINVRVVSVENKSILWEPVNFKKAESVSKFYNVANAIIDEFSKIIPVEPQVKNIRNDNSIIIDVGAKLGINKGKRFYVISEMQFGSVFDKQIDTLALVEVTQVTDDLSLAKIISKYKDMIVGAKLVRTTAEVDETPPVIQHEPVLSAGKFMDIPIEAEISDNKMVKRTTLYYSALPTVPFKSLPLRRKVGQKNVYAASIPAGEIGENKAIYYYIEAEDGEGNVRTLKASTGEPFAITIKAIDNTPPQITYNQPQEKAKSNEIIFTAKVMDDVRVKEVILHYRFDNFSPFKSASMKLFAQDVYGIGIPFAEIASSNIWYYIQATDFAGNSGFIGKPDAPILMKVSSRDITPPQIIISQTLSQRNDGTFILKARVMDENNIKEVSFNYFLNNNNAQPNSIPMRPAGNGIYRVVFSPTVKDVGQIEYYVRACDENNNCANSLRNVYLANVDEKTRFKDNEPPSFNNFYKINFGLKTWNYKKGGNLVYPVIFKVKDNVGVDRVEVFYRSLGNESFQSMTMGKISDDNDYGDLIIGSDYGVEFYFKAVDNNKNIALFGSPDDPFRIKINQDPSKMGKLPSTVEKHRKNRGN